MKPSKTAETPSNRRWDLTEGKRALKVTNGWLICAICGNRFIPGRTSQVDPPECGDVVKHAGVLRESSPRAAAYCSFCLNPLPEGSRKSRMFCDANCRNKSHYALNKNKTSQEGMGKDANLYAKSQEGTKIES